MPVTDYKKGMIYKLCCRDTSVKEVYIGSTCDFKTRKYYHKHVCNNPAQRGHNNPKYQFIREHGGWDNWDMVLIAYAPCETKLELLKIEREYIEKQEKSLNHCIPSRTRKEWHQDCKAKVAAWGAAYRAKNKETRAANAAARYNKNREALNAHRAEKVICAHCGSNIRRDSKARHQKTEKCLAAQAANEANLHQ